MISKVMRHTLLPIAFPLTLFAQGFPPTPVIVDAVVRRDVEDEFTIVGRVQPRRGGLIASETDGKVVTLVREEGTRALRGEVILRMENEQLRASLLEAEADLSLQKFNFARTEELLQREVVPEQSIRDARYQLARSRAKYRDLFDRIKKLAIRAPYDGHVVQIIAEIGEWVKRGEGVFRYISMDTVFVYVNVPERHVGSLSAGDSTDLFVDALGANPIPSRIVAVIPEGYPESHTFPIIVGALNPEGKIRSNMSAKVRFTIARDDSVTLVHKDALINSPLGQTVYLAVEGKAAAKRVKAGLAYNGYVAVQGDLKPGDLAIVRGNERLRDGQAIKVLRSMQ